MDMHRIILLQVSQYLENYFWPNFNAETAMFEHVTSMILIIYEKVCGIGLK